MAWLALFGGAGYFGLALAWIVEPFLVEPETYGWMGPFAVVLMAFGLSLFWAAAALIAGRFDGWRRPAMLVIALTVAEFARGHVLTGFPWAAPGQVWIDTPVAQLAALAGPTGLTLLTLAAAALPAAFRWRGASTAVVLLGAVAAFGTWRLAEPAPPPRETVVRLVQPNADQGLKWDPEMARVFFDRLIAASGLPPSGDLPPPDLVIWPETAVPYRFDTSPGLAEMIGASGRGAAMAVGVQRVEGTRAWNSFAVLGPDGVQLTGYDKHHLVPFGEYIPFGDLAYDVLGLTAFAAQQGNGYTPGPGPAVLDLGPGLGRILPLICYEAVFPQDLLRAPGRADWILQITNDAWFGSLTGPYQHLAQARLRAIEQGLPMVRVANTGISAVIDAKGRVLDSLPLNRQGHLDARVPGALPPTPFARMGETPVLLLLAALWLGLWLAGRPQRA